MTPPPPFSSARRATAFALVDVLLAVTIFALSVTGLVVTMQKINDSSNAYSRDRLIQYGIESAIAEAKVRPVAEMNTESRDELLQVTYTTLTEPLEISNADGQALKDLYKVTVTASFLDDGGEQQQKAETYVYKPAEEKTGTSNR